MGRYSNHGKLLTTVLNLLQIEPTRSEPCLARPLRTPGGKVYGVFGEVTFAAFALSGAHAGAQLDPRRP